MRDNPRKPQAARPPRARRPGAPCRPRERLGPTPCVETALDVFGGAPLCPQPCSRALTAAVARLSDGDRRPTRPTSFAVGTPPARERLSKSRMIKGGGPPAPRPSAGPASNSGRRFYRKRRVRSCRSCRTWKRSAGCPSSRRSPALPWRSTRGLMTRRQAGDDRRSHCRAFRPSGEGTASAPPRGPPGAADHELDSTANLTRGSEHGTVFPLSIFLREGL